MSAYLPDFFIIPSQLIIDPEIKSGDYLIYGAIYWFSQMRLQRCTLSNDAMASLVGLSESTARQGIYRLIERGYVEATYADDDKTKRLELIPRIVMGGVGTPTGGVSVQRQGGVGTPTHNKNIKKENGIYKEETSYNNLEELNVNEKEVEPERESSSLAVSSRSESAVQDAAKTDPEILVDYFNSVYNRKFGKGQIAQITGTAKKGKKTINLFEYWSQFYSLDEMKQAIDNSKLDNWWKDKLTPVILLRTGNPQGEPVDYIGKFLNMKIPVKIRPLTDQEFYDILKELKVPADHVKKRYARLMEMVESGKFKNEDDDETVGEALKRWVKSDLTKGYVDYCNEIEMIDLEDYEPKNLLGKRALKKQREYHEFKDKFQELKASLDEAEPEQAEKIKAQLKEMAPIGKKLYSEYREMYGQLAKLREQLDV